MKQSPSAIVNRDDGECAGDGAGVTTNGLEGTLINFRQDARRGATPEVSQLRSGWKNVGEQLRPARDDGKRTRPMSLQDIAGSFPIPATMWLANFPSPCGAKRDAAMANVRPLARTGFRTEKSK
ncbi:MAG: hypothetical protein PHY43_06550 [Verrucomicrobiales bacterium]|nr:hypothetical protein [Verrucomicrobiales bacterium]